jgi:threonyl-tRNA synthetase
VQETSHVACANTSAFVTLRLYAGTVSQVRNDIHDAGFYVDVDSSDRKLDKKVVLLNNLTSN